MKSIIIFVESILLFVVGLIVALLTGAVAGAAGVLWAASEGHITLGGGKEETEEVAAT